jgi:hypothetical protein
MVERHAEVIIGEAQHFHTDQATAEDADHHKVVVAEAEVDERCRRLTLHNSSTKTLLKP